MWRFPSTARCTVRDCCKGKNHHRTFDNSVHKLSPFFPLLKRTFQGKNCLCESVCPSCCCLGANPLISCVSMNRYFTRKREKTSFFRLFFECFVWLQHGSSVIVHCSRVDLDLMSESHDNAFSIQCFLKDNVTSYTLQDFFLVFKKLCCHYPSPSTRMHVCVCMYVVWMSKCT